MADKPEKKRIQPTKINWVEAQKLYIQDHTMSYAKIAKRFGVSLKAVQDRGTNEGWPRLRQEVAEKAKAKHLEKTTEQLAKLNNDHESAFTELYEAAKERIAKMRANIKDGQIKSTDASQLQQLGNAMKTGIEGVRVINGLPIIIAKSDVRADLDQHGPRDPDEVEETMDALDERNKRMKSIMARQEPVTGKQEAKA